MDRVFATDVMVNRRQLRMTRRRSLPGTGVNNHRADRPGPSRNGADVARRVVASANQALCPRLRDGTEKPRLKRVEQLVAVESLE